jgi:FAD/FMN-containing dehydrogenase
MPDITNLLADIVGDANVLTGDAAKRYSLDWKQVYSWVPLAVVRPANTAEVSSLVKLAQEHGIAVTATGGNTGLNGGTSAPGGLMISLERMNKIQHIRPDARVAVVQAGVVLANLHEATAALGLAFPLTFGARGSAQIGGCLSTNAGGSNVVRYGNTRALVLGIEVVLPDGEVLDLMTELHKDNTGYDLRDLFIGAEGTLGIITAAVLKLVPKQQAYATAMVSATSISSALRLLNKLQDATDGLVEAFEYMPRSYMDALKTQKPDIAPPLGHDRDHTIMIELGATAMRDCTPGDDGTIPLVSLLETVLMEGIEEGLADDAVIAQNATQRSDMWAMRELSAEVVFSFPRFVDTDVAVPLDRFEAFLTDAEAARMEMDPASELHLVAHLGDGNLHYTILQSEKFAEDLEPLREMVERIALSHGGSFSAEHGIGLSKLGGMRRRKNPVALKVMRQIKSAIDPKGLMNPGKTIPDV